MTAIAPITPAIVRSTACQPSEAADDVTAAAVSVGGGVTGGVPVTPRTSPDSPPGEPPPGAGLPPMPLIPPTLPLFSFGVGVGVAPAGRPAPPGVGVGVAPAG